MEPFKNVFNADAAKKIAHALKKAHPAFDQSLFLEKIQPVLEPLELKDRMLELTRRLKMSLPSDPRQSFPVLVRALKKNDKDTDGLSGFLVWPLTQFVADNGLAHFELSMSSLHAMTQVFTAEFAIRNFLIHEETKTLKKMYEWTGDSSAHVRRLASEGSRPLLPWGQKIHAFVQEPEKTWSLLEKLKNDPSVYVQKSVANHINDHSKNHGDWVVKKLKTWHEPKVPKSSVNWIVRHATRTLVKKGHSGALGLHGIKAVELKVLSQKIKKQNLRLGQFLEFELSLKNLTKKPAVVMLDHEILFLKANNKHSPKVFKGTRKTLKANESLKIEGRIPLKKVTTRKHYNGKQLWTPLINGQRLKSLPFKLIESPSH